ncbi:atp-dependent rna helicase [Stylonychia lemnae]|uniref:Atp-dependent rna helicase n=1 Tax=Stylonychia lemnae TaxID=5949 RepID=A0A078B6N6_STYLE|nr:atp-dependent rna helicase [Stylonychia lemnae]|eukprot:CDW90034.1 atp-dependent rna helicase [Stylonychia lemnae]
MILTSETGSGKTLAYLLPILNQLFQYKDRMNAKPKAARFKMNKQNEEQMFLSAAEITYMSQKQSQAKRLSFSKGYTDEMKGAIILSYSKELLSQVYVQARTLDLNERILINRVTSQLQMKTPISPDKEKGEKEMTETEQFEIQLKNAVNNASWKITDILLATPVVMSHIIENKDKYDPYDINPAVIVIDEFDELLSNSAISAQLVKILRKYATFNSDSDPITAQQNKKRQFIFTGATIPKSIMNGHDAITLIQDWIPNIQHVKTDNLHRTSPMLQVEWIDLERSQLLRANSIKKVIDKICEALKKAEIKNLPYYMDIGLLGRQTTLQYFQNKKLPVLVCSNIASRGLDTMNVEHVIQFEFAKTAGDYLHRVGRAGRLGQKGFVTNFIRKIDYELEQKIRELDQQNESYDQIINKKKGLGTVSPTQTLQKKTGKNSKNDDDLLD